MIQHLLFTVLVCVSIGLSLLAIGYMLADVLTCSLKDRKSKERQRKIGARIDQLLELERLQAAAREKARRELARARVRAWLNEGHRHVVQDNPIVQGNFVRPRCNCQMPEPAQDAAVPCTYVHENGVDEL